MFEVNFLQAGFTATWNSQHTSAPSCRFAGSSLITPRINFINNRVYRLKECQLEAYVTERMMGTLSQFLSHGVCHLTEAG
jgi:hypothetical protein